MKSGQGLKVEEVMAICGQREKSQCKDPEALDAWMCGDQSDAERPCMGLHGCDCNTAGISKQRCSEVVNTGLEMEIPNSSLIHMEAMKLIAQAKHPFH